MNEYRCRGYRKAEKTAAPDDIPTSIPSFLAMSFAVSNASALETLITSS